VKGVDKMYEIFRENRVRVPYNEIKELVSNRERDSWVKWGHSEKGVLFTYYINQRIM
jgi:hypothetical protein